MENKKANFSIQAIWNEQLLFGREEKELKKRDRIWASEIGKSHYERWLKMNGVKPDFDYDERTLRKFEAGNFFERVVAFVLVASGLLIHDNKWYNIPADKEHLEVSVKPDFIAGGKPDWEKVKARVEAELLFKLMPNLARIAKQLIKEFSEKYPNGLGELVYEIKSLNSMIFWAKKDYLQEAYPHHIMQTFTGMKATGLPAGRILYISKDDLTVVEFGLFLETKRLNDLWEDDVKKMTYYIREGIEPPKPANIVFDQREKLRFQHNKEKKVIEGCYVPNWEIGWSNYITHITGIEGKEQKEVSAEWEERIKEELRVKNAELKERLIKGKID